MSKSNVLTLIFFIAFTLAGGSLIGFFSAPGPWYAQLVKPSFNPPNWVFGPVWSVLYLLIGIAGARVWRNHRQTVLPKLWFAQMALNFLWPLAFFTARRPDLALPVIIVLLVTILAFVAKAWHRERPAALMFIPYALWVGFAALLNGALWWLNT